MVVVVVVVVVAVVAVVVVVAAVVVVVEVVVVVVEVVQLLDRFTAVTIRVWHSADIAAFGGSGAEDNAVKKLLGKFQITQAFVNE